VEPVADVELNVPGEIEIVVALAVVQFRVLLVPEFTLVGLAANEAIDGVPVTGGVFEVVVALPQPDKAAHAARSSRSAPSKELRQDAKLLVRKELSKFKRLPSEGVVPIV
jgi:hypothetical protein